MMLPGSVLGSFLVFLLAAVWLASPVAAGQREEERYWQDAHANLAVEKSAAQHTRIRWWREARLGLLVLWPTSSDMTGVAAAPPASPPDKDGPPPDKDGPPPDPDPLVRFEPKALVELIQQAGMKYLLVGVKTRDGRCLWPTQLADAPQLAQPVRRDLIGELAAAAKAANLPLGLYVSQGEAQAARFHGDPPRYGQYLQQQVGELLGRYETAGVLECDASGLKPDVAAAEPLLRLIGGQRPALVVNNRLGVPGDFDAPQPLYNIYNTRRNWEGRMTLADAAPLSGGPPGNPAFDELLRRLVYCAGADGNLLVELQLLPGGLLPPDAPQRLERLGHWLERYGDSLYGTSGGPYRPGEWGACTRRDNRLFLHILDWARFPAKLPVLTRQVTGVKVLTNVSATVKQYKDGLSIQVPPEHHDDPETIVAVDLDGPAADIQPITVQERKTRDKGRRTP